MNKMGISTIQSYKGGAQVFEGVGLAGEIVVRCFLEPAPVFKERASKHYTMIQSISTRPHTPHLLLFRVADSSTIEEMAARHTHHKVV